MKWKDCTSYSRGDEKRTPNTFEAKVGPLLIVVTNGHIYYPGKWITHCLPIYEMKPLKAVTCEDAQKEAEAMARDWIANAGAAFSSNAN